jgi:CO/xanthine dehydrogenase Mo-binding subunit
MNPSLAEYHVPVNLDIPYLEIIYNGIPDSHAPLGAREIGDATGVLIDALAQVSSAKRAAPLGASPS